MAETVYSGSVEPDQARTCEGNKRNNHFYWEDNNVLTRQ